MRNYNEQKHMELMHGLLSTKIEEKRLLTYYTI